VTAEATKLNFWNSTWSLDEKQCPCDIHFVDYMGEKDIRGKTIFHFGTGNHHIIGLRNAHQGRDNAILGITASPDEYDAYIKLLIENPRLGFTYKVYFGDIYQTDARLVPALDYALLFHIGEFWSDANKAYGALTDLEMATILADRLRAGGELITFSGSFAWDKADATAAALVAAGKLAYVGPYKSLKVYRKAA
jgi:hypothetical protein